MSTQTISATRRNASDRGVTNWSWLDSRHTFSFGRYVDREWIAFGPLRVINDDRVAGGGGFDTHGHEDMEIITIVVDGELRHADTNSAGEAHESVLRRGDVQIMSAGSGVRHSEHNASDTDGLRFIQIWIEPREQGLEPRYQERVGVDQPPNELVPAVTGDAGDGAMDMYQDGAVLTGFLNAGETVTHDVRRGRSVWVQVVEGVVAVGGEQLVEGDGLGIGGAERLEITASEDAFVIVFEV